MSKIAKIGPQNVALLDTERGTLETNDNKILTVHEELYEKIKSIKDGSFPINDDIASLEIIGDVQPILGIIQEVKGNLLTEYLLSATEVAKAIKEQLPNISRNTVWEIIKDTDMKNNKDYSVCNFRNKKQEDLYKETGKLPSGTPSIYSHKAVDFIVDTLKSQESKS